VQSIHRNENLRESIRLEPSIKEEKKRGSKQKEKEEMEGSGRGRRKKRMGKGKVRGSKRKKEFLCRPRIALGEDFGENP